MNAFAKFIESDAFFPILILLLVLFILVFVWLIVSNKKEEKMRRLQRRNVIIDESAEIKIISDNKEVKELKEVKEDIEFEEETNDEIRIIEEFQIKTKQPEIVVPGPEEEVAIEEELVFDDYDNKNVNTGSTFVIPVPGKEEEKPISDVIDIEYTPATTSEVSYGLDEYIDEEIQEDYKTDIVLDSEEDEEEIFDDAKVIDDYISNLSIPVRTEEYEDDDEEYDIPITKSIEEEGEEIDIPVSRIDIEDGVEIKIPTISEETILPKEEVVNAFGFNPTDNFAINEDIKYENPKEYTGEKTEVWDFDFEKYELDKEEAKAIEDEIINAAKEYIDNIMKKN